jgi:hypothetical protein
MKIGPEPARRDNVGSATAPRDSLKVSLDCPECGATGLVDWKSLNNGMGCPQCGCRFLIGRGGRVLSQADLPHVRYTCPRCKKSAAVPSMLAVRGIDCAGCELPLVLGPDQRLYSVAEADERWRSAGMASRRPSLADWLTKKFTKSDGRVRMPVVFSSAAALAVVVVFVIVTVVSMFDRSPETLARRFVQTCLTGDWDAATLFFGDDAVQQASFDRWRLHYFPSILDQHRPAGDKVDVTVRVLEDDANTRLFLVTLKSEFLGSRSQVQNWHLRDGQWLFDARGTLARETTTASVPRIKEKTHTPIRSKL